MSSFMIFDQLHEEEEEGDAWAQIADKMQNPFTIMRRWLKFEILDLEAILEAVDKSAEM